MIAVMGGTFDPIHFGHLRSALEVYDALPVDAIRLVPAGLPPHRAPPVASAQHRASMVEQAIAGRVDLRLDRRELERPGPSYTVDTLESLRQETGPQQALALCVGADALSGFRTWYRWERILELAHLIVLRRPGTDPAISETILQGAPLVRAGSPEELRHSPGGSFWLAEVTALDISSTRIRTLLQQGKPADFLLPQSVLRYIHDQELYR